MKKKSRKIHKTSSADFRLRIEPIEVSLSSGFGGVSESSVFFEDATGGVLQQSFVEAIETGAKDALRQGWLAGYEIINVRVILLEAQPTSYHTELEFESAARLAVQRALPRAGVIMLEPVMRIQILMPVSCLGVVLKDLGKRRGIIRNIETRGKNGNERMVHADAPLAELFQYTTTLRTLTRGRARESMEPLMYAPMPDRQQSFLKQQYR